MCKSDAVKAVSNTLVHTVDNETSTFCIIADYCERTPEMSVVTSSMFV